MADPFENAPYLHLINRKDTTAYLLYIVVPVQGNTTCSFPNAPTLDGNEYLIDITINPAQGTGIVYTQVKKYLIDNSNTSARIKVNTSILTTPKSYGKLELGDASSITFTDTEWNDLVGTTDQIAYNMPYLYLFYKETTGGLKRMHPKVLIPLKEFTALAGSETVGKGATQDENIGYMELNPVSGSPLAWYLPTEVNKHVFAAKIKVDEDNAYFVQELVENNGGTKKKKGKVKGKSKNHVDNPFLMERRYLKRLAASNALLQTNFTHSSNVKTSKGKVQITLEFQTDQDVDNVEATVLEAIRTLGCLGIEALKQARDNKKKKK